MSNPTYSKVKEGAKLAKENEVDFMIAVGGGFVIDCCKIVSVQAKTFEIKRKGNYSNVSEEAKDEIKNNKRPELEEKLDSFKSSCNSSKILEGITISGSSGNSNSGKEKIRNWLTGLSL